MREEEPHQPEQEKTPQDVDVQQERRVGAGRLNIDLLVRRCRRLGIQPREFFGERLNQEGLIEAYGEEAINNIFATIHHLPDYELDTPEGRNAAAKDLQELFIPLIAQERQTGLQEHFREHLTRIGILAYEIDNAENHRSLILHLPPTLKRPGAH